MLILDHDIISKLGSRKTYMIQSMASEEHILFHKIFLYTLVDGELKTCLVRKEISVEYQKETQ